LSALKITRLAMFDGMELKEATFRQRAFPEHFHESYSIAIIEQGTERLCYGPKEIIGHAHAVLVANPHEVHAHGFFDEDACRYRALYIPVELVRHVCAQHSLWKGRSVWFRQGVIDDACLFQAIRDFHLDAATAKAGHLYRIIRYMITHYAIEKPETDFRPSADIADAAHFLIAHLADKLGMEAVARRHDMDKFKFIRAFRRQTGLTPVSYLLLHRIDKAKQLIAGAMPLVEVALETGFYDQSHFIHYFKMYVGIAPLEYRQSLSLR
jgi:AraC-like DNA-binding protein